MNRERWGEFDENAKLRERIAVLETNLSAMQTAIRNLTDGQNANRAFSERNFNDIKLEIAEMKTELSDIKIVVSSRSSPSDGQRQMQQLVFGIAILFAVLVIVLLLLWVRLGTMGIHL